MPDEQSSFPPLRAELLLEGRRRLARAFLIEAPIVCEPRAALLRAGECPARVFRLISGWAVRERVLDDGSAILAVHLPGDFVGLDGLFSARVADSVVALTPVSCRTLSIGELTRLVEQEPAVALRVAHLLDRQRQRAERLAAELGRCDAEVRLASFLLDLYDRLRDRDPLAGRSFRLPLTQQQIGDCLGITVVHVNRVLRGLREEGVVLVKQNTAVITDLERLRRLADKGVARPPGEGRGAAVPAAGSGSSSRSGCGRSTQPCG